VSSAAASWALRLARDPETFASLLRGEPVDPERLDEAWLARAKALRLVRLDVLACELFEHSIYPPDQGERTDGR
jgi:hypothetical protein